MIQPSIRIWWDNDVGVYRCSIPYNATVNDLLNQAIPFSERSLDKESKIWSITEQAMPAFRKIAESVFKSQATVITKEQAQKASASPSITKATLDSVLLDFVKLLPYEAAQKAFRLAALTLHPDRVGGDMEKMSRLNAAWTRIEKEFYNQ